MDLRKQRIFKRFCTRPDKVFIEQLKNMYGEEEFMDEEILEILHEKSFQKKEIQIRNTFIQFFMNILKFNILPCC